MKDLIIITDLSIDSSTCSPLLKEAFSNKTIHCDCQDYLLIKKDGKGFQIDYTPNDILSDPECMMGDTVEKCPNKNAFLTNLGYSTMPIAIKVIKTLLPHYGRMWIEDEENDTFSTAEEFIKQNQN